MSIRDDQPITEALAIALGSWLVVAGQRVTPEGIVVDTKNFCSAECLADYVNPLVAEYKAAEDRYLAKKAVENFDKPNIESLRSAAYGENTTGANAQ